MLTKLMLTTGLVVLGAGSALAQDGGTDWTGFYAGVYGGYAIDEDNASSQGLEGSPSTEVEGLFTYDVDYSPISTAIGGVRAGYNFQHGPLVLGVEGSVGGGSFSKSNTGLVVLNYIDEVDPEDPGDMEDDSYSFAVDSKATFETDAYGTFEGKIGFGFDNWLLYGKAGIVVAHAKASNVATFEYASADPDDEGILYSGHSDAEGLTFGPTFGIGAETYLAENVSMGAELNVMQFGKLDGVDTVIIPYATEFGGVEAISSATVYTAKVGLNYHF